MKSNGGLRDSPLNSVILRVSQSKQRDPTLENLMKDAVYDFRMRILSIKSFAAAGGIGTQEKYDKLIIGTIHDFACAVAGVADAWLNGTSQHLIFQHDKENGRHEPRPNLPVDERFSDEGAEKVVTQVMQRMNETIKKDLAKLLKEASKNNKHISQQELDNATARTLKVFALELAEKAGSTPSKNILPERILEESKIQTAPVNIKERPEREAPSEPVIISLISSDESKLSREVFDLTASSSDSSVIAVKKPLGKPLSSKLSRAASMSFDWGLLFGGSLSEGTIDELDDHKENFTFLENRSNDIATPSRDTSDIFDRASVAVTGRSFTDQFSIYRGGSKQSNEFDMNQSDLVKNDASSASISGSGVKQNTFENQAHNSCAQVPTETLDEQRFCLNQIANNAQQPFLHKEPCVCQTENNLKDTGLQDVVRNPTLNSQCFNSADVSLQLGDKSEGIKGAETAILNYKSSSEVQTDSKNQKVQFCDDWFMNVFSCGWPDMSIRRDVCASRTNITNDNKVINSADLLLSEENTLPNSSNVDNLALEDNIALMNSWSNIYYGYMRKSKSSSPRHRTSHGYYNTSSFDASGVSKLGENLQRILEGKIDMSLILESSPRKDPVKEWIELNENSKYKDIEVSSVKDSAKSSEASKNQDKHITVESDAQKTCIMADSSKIREESQNNNVEESVSSNALAAAEAPPAKMKKWKFLSKSSSLKLDSFPTSVSERAKSEDIPDSSESKSTISKRKKWKFISKSSSKADFYYPPEDVNNVATENKPETNRKAFVKTPLKEGSKKHKHRDTSLKSISGLSKKNSFSVRAVKSSKSKQDNLLKVGKETTEEDGSYSFKKQRSLVNSKNDTPIVGSGISSEISRMPSISLKRSDSNVTKHGTGELNEDLPVNALVGIDTIGDGIRTQPLDTSEQENKQLNKENANTIGGKAEDTDHQANKDNCPTRQDETNTSKDSKDSIIGPKSDISIIAATASKSDQVASSKSADGEKKRTSKAGSNGILPDLSKTSTFCSVLTDRSRKLDSNSVEDSIMEFLLNDTMTTGL